MTLLTTFVVEASCWSNTHPIRLHYKQKGEVAEVVLPGSDSAALQKLLAACRRTTSEVAALDSGRHEFYLGSDMLTTSFQLSATSILNEIGSLLIPDRYICTFEPNCASLICTCIQVTPIDTVRVMLTVYVLGRCLEL